MLKDTRDDGSIIKRNAILNGRHSMIPECCIKFYITTWSKLCKNGKYSKKMHFIEKDFRNSSNLFPISYILCPECVRLKRIVSIHYCKDEGTCTFKPLKRKLEWK